MVKVLIISPESGVTGGIQKWTQTIMSYYKDCSESTSCRLSIFDFSRKTSGQLASSIFSRVFALAREYFSLIRSSLKVISTSDSEVVHISSPGSFLLVRDLLLINRAKKFGKRVVVHFHFGRIPKILKSKGFEYFALSRVLSKADSVIVMDKSSLESLKSSGYSKVSYIPNPFSRRLLDIRHSSDNSRNNDTVLFVGHVLESKGIIELLMACKSVGSVRLKIVGCVSNSMRERLYRLAGPDFCKNLEITGEVDHDTAFSEMSRCGVFVLPSYTEGFPNVILESMACGCRIVSTSVGAIPEMLDVDNPSDVCGVCVQPRDPEALASAVSRMINDVEFAQSCSENAKKRVLELYSDSVVWDKLCKLWHSVAN